MMNDDQGNFRHLKRNINVPMALISTVAGLLGAIQGSVMRGFTISSSIRGLFYPVTLLYLLVAVLLAALQLQSLNVAMSIYKQTQIVPIY